MLCRSLLSWTKQDKETRKQHFHNRLIKFVKVDQFPFSLIKDLLKESLIQENADYYNLLNEKFMDIKSISKIISIGGRPGRTKAKVKVDYILNSQTNESYPDLPISLDYHRSIKTNNFLYIIGGKDQNNQIESNQAFRLNLNEKVLKWEEIASMNVGRSAPGVAVFNDTIVVCGGHDGSKRLSSAETYNATLNQWINIEFLNQGRSGNESATSGGCLYTMGGWNGRNYLSFVERLDALDQVWKSVSFMQTPRYMFAAVSCNDVIYVIGGSNNNSNAVETVEKYDCASDKWIYVSKMNIERCFHSACVMRGKIFVVGGWNADFKPVKEIECYDPSTDRWEIVARIDDELIAQSLVVM